MSTGHRPDPDERVVELRVDTLNVVDSQRLVEHLLVERQREPAVYELTMIQRLYSHTHTHTHKSSSSSSSSSAAAVPYEYEIYRVGPGHTTNTQQAVGGRPPQYAPAPCDLDLLTLKVVSESRVTWATFVQILVFLGLSVFDLGPMYATDVRKTYVRQHHHLMPPPKGRGHNKTMKQYIKPKKS